MFACMHDVSDAIVANQLAILARENGREYYRGNFLVRAYRPCTVLPVHG